jgi:hypothetical protein
MPGRREMSAEMNSDAVSQCQPARRRDTHMDNETRLIGKAEEFRSGEMAEHSIVATRQKCRPDRGRPTDLAGEGGEDASVHTSPGA